MNEKSLSSVEKDAELLRPPLPETWAGSPLNPQDDEVKPLQARVYDILDARAATACQDPALHLSEQLKDVVDVCATQNFYRESTRNYESYCNTPKPAIVHADYKEAFEKARFGMATPGEFLDIRADISMPSVEVAKLSHIGGILLEYLPVMRDATEEAIIERGGILTNNSVDTTRLFVVGTNSIMFNGDPSHKKTLGVIMKRKRTIGSLPDGTIIKERSRFILRTDDESPLDDKLIRAIRQVKIEQKDGPGNTYRWLNDQFMGYIDGFESAVRQAVAELEASLQDPTSENSYDTIIPLNTTAYAYNEAAERRNTSEKLQRARQRRAATRAHLNKLSKNVLFLASTVEPIENER